MIIIKNLWENFSDKFGRSIIHPQYIMRSYTYEAIKEAKRYAKGKLVDIGCGTMSYRKELEPQLELYVGVDHPQSSKLYSPKRRPDVLADASELPFDKNMFDTALILQVLEYVKSPQNVIDEAVRVLKPGGILILTSPFLYPLHDIPYDRARYSETFLRDLVHNSSLQIVKLKVQGSFLDFWLQSLNVFLLKKINNILSDKKLINMILVLPLMIITIFIVLSNNIIVAITRKKPKIFKNHENYFPLDYLLIARKNKF